MSLYQAFRAAILAGDDVAINALIDHRIEDGRVQADHYIIFTSCVDDQIKMVKIPRTITFEEAKSALEFAEQHYDRQTVIGAAFSFAGLDDALPFAESIAWLRVAKLDSEIWLLITKPIADAILAHDYSRFHRTWDVQSRRFWDLGIKRLKGISKGDRYIMTQEGMKRELAATSDCNS